MKLQVGPELTLAFGLLFARAAGVTLGLPAMLGVGLPIRLRVLLAALLAGALMSRASVTLPVAAGVLPIVLLVIRELGVGVMLSFAAALVFGAAIMAGDLIGAGMELNTGGLLRVTTQIPNVAADAFGTLAELLFFIGGFHRTLLIALARSVDVAPLGQLTLPPPSALIRLGGRLFVLALGLGLPLLIPLFVLALAQGAIARLAPQVNILVAAPAAIVLAGLFLLTLDAAGLTAGITRVWSSVMAEALGWLNG
ncbi:MAG TPA: flagellar biosynthetic protein FliR [Candidatus Binataceae bacterium]|nr:flagellar biosynthetic protein FliR [Candidatus Binataceae bacterium]